MHGGVTRLKEHLAGISGDVVPCCEAPPQVRDAIKDSVIQKKQERVDARMAKKQMEEELRAKPVDPYADDSDEDDDDPEDVREKKRAMRASRQSYIEVELRRESLRMGAGSSGAPGLARSSSRAGRLAGMFACGSAYDIEPTGRPAGVLRQGADPLSFSKKGKTQPQIKASFMKNAKSYIGRAIAKFFYFNHIPYNVTNSPYYKPMVDAIAETGRGVQPPTAWELSHTYLDNEHDDIKKYIETFHAHWDEYGCTLMCDGWSTQNRRKIINFLVYSTFGTVFLDSVDATDKFQSGKYIFELMDKYVELIGESRVVQVVTDNGANYKSAGQMLMRKREHLYWTPCAAHCIDLILADMAKEEDVKDIVAKSQMVTGFIYNKGWVLSLMRRETKGKELIRPAITRFATHFIALDSIYVHRDDLRRMVTSREWSENHPRLKPKDRAVANEVYELIHGDRFWQAIANVIAVFEPLVKVLRMVDSDDKAEMGYLYEAMDRVKEAIQRNVGTGYRKWWDMIDRRWDKQLHQDIHAAGYFLNPRFKYSTSATIDNEVLVGLRRVISRLEPDISTQIEIDKELDLYKMRAGYFGSEKATAGLTRFTPAQWWSNIGLEDAPNLTRLAVRILSQTVSSSNCERNWTTFSLIHTKTRNRLTMEHLKKLVFVHYNMRLRERHTRRSVKDDSQLIDLDQIFHEDDPLLEWTREIEMRELDDGDSSWLDEARVEAERQSRHVSGVNRNPTKQTYKRKKDVAARQESDNDSSSDDQGPAGGAVGTSDYRRPAEGSGYHAYDTQYTHGYRDQDRDQDSRYEREDRGGNTYGRQTEYPQHRQSFDYLGGYDHPASHEAYSGGYRGTHDEYFAPYRHSDAHVVYDSHYMYGSNVTAQSSSQDSHDMPGTEPSRSSPYDDIMISFLGPEQMQYGYPPYYHAPDDAGFE